MKGSQKVERSVLMNIEWALQCIGCGSVIINFTLPGVVPATTCCPSVIISSALFHSYESQLNGQLCNE